jgi:co-chaperonin GroES (HSP10)
MVSIEPLAFDIDWQMARDAKALTAIPQNDTGIHPTEFKVLILPDPVEEKTKGGIILAVETTEKEKYATMQGSIVAVSHLAFSYATAEEWGDNKPKAGDRVLFAKYAGVRHKAKDGVEYLLVNDKDIVAIVQ